MTSNLVDITVEEFQNNVDQNARFIITDSSDRVIECSLIKTNVNPGNITFIIGDHIMKIDGVVVNKGKRNHMDASNIVRIQKIM